MAQAGLNVFAVNSSSNTVTPYVTTSSGGLSASAAIAVGTFPHYVAVSNDGLFAYVSNRDSNSISVVSAASQSVIQTMATSNSPYGITVTEDNATVLVANRLQPAGCVGATCSPLVGVYDRNLTSGRLTLLYTIATQNTAQLRDITVLRDGVSVYVADQNNNRVIKLSLQTQAFVRTIAVGNQPLGISSNPVGSRVYVANFTSSDVSVIDTANDTVIATPDATSGGTFETDVTPDGKFFYCVNASGQTITTFNATTNVQIGATTATGQDPDSATVTPDGANLYVTNASNSDVIAMFRINPTTGVLTANGTVAAGNNPVGIGMQRYRLPSPPVVSTPPAPGSLRPSEPTWVGVRRHNLAMLVDFAAPRVGFYDDLTFRIYVVDKDLYPVTTVNASSSGVLIPFIRNEESYWVTVTAINGAGEGPTAPWVLSPAPDWAFYPKDRDGRPCPTAAPCQ